jgi:hypothetical protein
VGDNAATEDAPMYSLRLGVTKTYGEPSAALQQSCGTAFCSAPSMRRFALDEHGLPEWGGGDVDATDLDILEGWVGEVELSAHKLAAEISKLRTFIEEVNESEATGTDTASDDTGSGRKASSRRRSAQGS